MSAVRHAKAITPTFGPYGVDLELGAKSPRSGSTGARVAFTALLALGVLDVGVLDLQLAPRLSRAHVLARVAGARAAVEPSRAETTQAAAERSPPPIAPPTRGAPEGRQAPPTRARVKAMADIEFDLESVTTDNIEAIRGLHRVLDQLAAEGTRRLIIRGHADRLGAPEFNERLSRRRALAMRDWLAVRGAPIERMAVEAAGADEPADPGDGPVAWAHNRRCELLWD